MKKALISSRLLGLALGSAASFTSGSMPRDDTDFGWGKDVTRGTDSNISDERRFISLGRAQVRGCITSKRFDYHYNLNRETAPEVA